QHCRPEHAAVAVKHRGYWFYIDDRDADSKQTLTLVLVLTRVNLLGVRKGGPALTLPVGRWTDKFGVDSAAGAIDSLGLFEQRWPTRIQHELHTHAFAEKADRAKAQVVNHFFSHLPVISALNQILDCQERQISRVKRVDGKLVAKCGTVNRTQRGIENRQRA